MRRFPFPNLYMNGPPGLAALIRASNHVGDVMPNPAQPPSHSIANGQAKKLLAAIVESSDDAILAKTPEGIITFWNRGAERLYHYSAAEALGKLVSFLIP